MKHHADIKDTEFILMHNSIKHVYTKWQNADIECRATIIYGGCL